MERRIKRSGTLTEIPCRSCGAPLKFDPQSMQWRSGTPIQVCPACSGEIPVRYGDAFRQMIPETPKAAGGPRSRLPWA